jgi:hypothetical protein
MCQIAFSAFGKTSFRKYVPAQQADFVEQVLAAATKSGVPAKAQRNAVSGKIMPQADSSLPAT